jgi:hypothetical protein
MKTIVTQFQDEILKEHREPERQGVSKGDPIGFSWDKKGAALQVAITQKGKKQIAAELEISYSVLRKWETEDSFKALMKYYVSEFGPFVAEQAQQRQIKPGEWEEFSPAAHYSIRLAVKRKLERLSQDEIERVLRNLWGLPLSSESTKWVMKREPNKSYVTQELHLMRIDEGRTTDDPIGDILSELRARLYECLERYLANKVEDEAVEKAKRALRTLRETERHSPRRKEAA